MQLASTDVWVVRAGRNGVYADLFLSHGVVSIGWGEVGMINPDDSDGDIKQRFDSAFPSDKLRTRLVSAGMVKRFIREVQIGETVATYDPQSRLYHVGKVQSDAELGIRDTTDQDARQEFVRKVVWSDEIFRDELTVSTKNSLGSLQTIFRISPDASEEIRRLCLAGHGTTAALPDNESEAADDTDFAEIIQEYIEKSGQFVEDQISKLAWQEMQELVAGILRAMGYRTRISPPGSDRGVDVFA